MSVKYTIIIPVYNVISYIVECIDSVLAQNIDSWECIAVDDGSTDGSEKILDEYAAKDKRIRIVHKINGGVSSARNIALDIARGEWIVYLDADDMLAPCALAELSRLEQIHPNATILRYALKNFKEKSQLENDDLEVKEIIYSDRQKIIDGWNGASFVTYVYRRNIIGDLRFKPYSMGEDRLYLAEALLRTNLKIESNYIGYFCRLRPGSAMRSAETIKKVMDSIAWKRDILMLFDKTTVNVGIKTRRVIFLSLIEGCAFSIVSLTKNEQNIAWNFWFEVINNIPHKLIPTNWIRFVIRLLQKTKSIRIAYIFCVFPQWLKLSGFHR